MVPLELRDVLAIGARVSPFGDVVDEEVIARLLRRATPNPYEPERPVFDYAGVLLDDFVRGSGYLDAKSVARHVAAKLLEANGVVVDPDAPELREVVEDVACEEATALTAAAVLRRLSKKKKNKKNKKNK